MERKWFVMLSLVLGLLVVGCNSPHAQSQEGVMQVWTTWAGDLSQLQALFDRYSQEGGLPVRLSTGIKAHKLPKALDGPATPDLVILTNADPVASYHQQGLLEPLNAWIEATGVDLGDFYPAPLARCTAPDGTILCLPWGSDVDALFWNKAAFQAAGLDPDRPPETMEELVEYAHQLTIRDEEGALAQIGFIPDLSRSHTGLYARMFGGFWYGDDGAELTANSQAMVDAANWQLQLYGRYEPGKVDDVIPALGRYRDSSHPRFAGSRLDCGECHRQGGSEENPVQAFYDGQVAMMLGSARHLGPGAIPHLQPELGYGVAPFPPPAGYPERANTTLVRSSVAVIPVTAKHKAEAARLLAWMASPEVAAEGAYTMSNLPASRTAARHSRFLQIPDFQLFIDLLAHPNASHAGTAPISPELNESLGQVEAELLQNNHRDPLSLLNEVQAEFAPRMLEALTYREGQ